MAKVIVTGCAGFIGSHLTEALLSEGHEVWGIDDMSSGWLKNIRPFQNHPQFHFKCQDITNIDWCAGNIDYIYHLAAMGSVPRSIDDPSASFKNNVVITQRMLEVARSTKAKKFFFASSSSVYGDQDVEYKQEDLLPKPQSPYALYKLQCEQLCQMYKTTFGINAVSFRFFNVFGPRQNIDGEYSAVVPNICKAMLTEDTFTVYGNTKRDFTYVKDVVKVLLQAKIINTPEDIYNICKGYSNSIEQLCNDFSFECGTTLVSKKTGQRPGDVLDSKGSNQRLQRDFRTDIGLQEKHIIETFDYYRRLFDARDQTPKLNEEGSTSKNQARINGAGNCESTLDC